VVGLLVVLRFLVGATHAPLFPITSGGVIARWFPAGHWGLPNGLTLGAAATAPILVWLAESHGWRLSFIITTPMAFVLAVIWWYVIRDRPIQHPRMTASELEFINTGRATSLASGQARHDWRRVLGSRDAWLLTANYFCMQYVFFLFFNWFFYYLVEVKGFAAQKAGVLMAALWVIGAIGATLGGFLCDRLIAWLGARQGPRWMGSVCLLLCGVALYLGAINDDPDLAILYLSISFGFTQITEATYWSTATAIGGEQAPAACGLMNTGGNSAGFVGALLVPLIANSANWTIAISTGSIFALLGAISWLFVRGDHRIMD
jgi:ACS family glucarate transporter-like MFS transporter